MPRALQSRPAREELLKLKSGQEIEIDVQRAAMEGRGVGRLDDLVVFVDGALPGERVRARVESTRRRFATARAFELLRASPERVPGRCPHLGVCGGCSWQELAYEAQLDTKTELVREALARLGGFRDLEVPRALGSPQPFFYRNKMEYSFYAGRDGEIVLGLHMPGTYDRVFDLEACSLMSETSNRIVERVRDLARRSGKPAYHLRRHTGFWRYLVVREGKNTGQIMVNLVTNEGPLPNQTEIVRELASGFPAISSLLRSVNTRRATIAVGEREELLAGTTAIEEQLGDLRFWITANSFFQTNSAQAVRLFDLAVAWCELSGREEVLDLYSGTGAISLFLARRARRVTGIELVPEAVAMAKRNASLNGIDNCRFLEGEVREHFERRAGEVAAAEVVLLDPPRAGLHPDIVTALRTLQPPRIVYVSCNPASLARDLQMLCQGNLYRLQRVQPVDMFPHTHHIECVAQLERMSA